MGLVICLFYFSYLFHIALAAQSVEVEYRLLYYKRLASDSSQIFLQCSAFQFGHLPAVVTHQVCLGCGFHVELVMSRSCQSVLDEQLCLHQCLQIVEQGGPAYLQPSLLAYMLGQQVAS